MAFNDYLARLGRQLKGFSEEEKAALLEEIGNHIESGQQEVREGGSGDVALLAELGSPEALGQGFKRVHRPNRWLDFLLVVIPIYLFFPLIQALIIKFIYPSSNYVAPSQATWLDIRVEILIGIAFVGISLVRRSPLLAAFWAPDVMTRLVALMTRENRWWIGYGKNSSQLSLLESIVWYLVLLGVTYTLVRLLWRNRTDLLLIFFALAPLFETAANLGGYSLAAAYGLTPKFFDIFVIYWITGVISLAGIFLARRRTLRWLGLALGYAAYSVEMALGYEPRPALIAVWCLPLAAALFGWWMDSRQRRQTERQISL